MSTAHNTCHRQVLGNHDVIIAVTSTIFNIDKVKLKVITILLTSQYYKIEALHDF